MLVRALLCKQSKEADDGISHVASGWAHHALGIDLLSQHVDMCCRLASFAGTRTSGVP